MQPRPDQIVLGVDTHAETHTAVVVDGLGRVLGTVEVPATMAGYRRLVRWARRHGDLVAVGVEGTGAYGAGLTRHLTKAGVEVIEVDRPNRQRRRRRGKSDPTDAEAAARAVLAGEATTVPKDRTGVVEAIRILHVTRRSAVKAKTQAANQMKDLILTAPDPIRAKLRGLSTRQRVQACASWRPGTATPTDPSTATRRALHDLACRWLVLHDEARMLEAQLRELLTATVPSLMAEQGVGSDSAAKLVIAAGQNPERLHSEAAFAALCGTSPVENSSGQRSGHRLNRGGNRQANNALHTVAMIRAQRCTETRAYLAKRAQAPTSTPRRDRRCLKRMVARRLYHALMTDLRPHLK